MSVGNKVRMIPPMAVLGLIGIIGLAVVAFVPSIKDSVNRNARPVTVTVDFTPAQRSGVRPPGATFPDIVTIELIVGGGAGRKYTVTSRWTTVVYPDKGNVVMVSASQVYGNAISCLLEQQGNLPHRQAKTGPAQVNCKLVSI